MYVGGIGTLDKVLTGMDARLSSSVIFRDPAFGPFSGPAIFVSLALFSLTPQLSKLWLALDDEKNVPKTLLWAFGAIFFMAMIFWIGGLGGRALFPDIKPDTATVAILKTYWPPWLAAFGMVGILAAIMSTAAGLFLVVAVAIAVDIYRDSIVPIMKKQISKEALDMQVLWMQRILIPVVTVVGMLVAQNPPKSLTQLMWVGIGVFVAGTVPVMVVGCLWKKTTKAAAEIAAIIGVLLYMFMQFGMGQYMGMAFFKVPWSCCGVACIVCFVLVITLSFVTKPMEKEYVAAIFKK